MKRLLAVATLGLIGLACSDTSFPSASRGALLSGSFATVPLRFSMVPSSFSATADNDSMPYRPGDGDGHEHDGMYGGYDGGMHRRGDGMMCGGLGGPFGGLGFGLGFGHGLRGGSLPPDCVFDAASGRVNCPPDTIRGVVVTRSVAYADTLGNVQSAYDSTSTDVINQRVTVSGTVIRRNGDTSAVEHESDRTVSGLAPGSTERTVNGTAAGQETTTGSDSAGSFVLLRVVGDTITGVVIPVPAGYHDADDDEDDGHDDDHDYSPMYGPKPFPTAGTIVREMTVTFTRGTEAPVTSSRREVVTYNGDGTATVVITKDGSTKTCTITSGEHERPVCQ